MMYHDTLLSCKLSGYPTMVMSPSPFTIIHNQTTRDGVFSFPIFEIGVQLILTFTCCLPQPL